MAYTMQDLLFGVGGSEANPIGGVCGKLTYRQDIVEKGGLQKLQDAILELSRDYRFQGLEETGPTTVLIPGQAEYPISYFTNANTEVVNLIPSFYMYYLEPSIYASNPGTNLMWKTIDALELMINTTPGVPAYFTRYGDSVYIAPTPTLPNQIYMRYQKEHPFSTPVALADPFMLPNEWKEIAEYAGALRFANDTRMLDYAEKYHSTLFGDPENPRKVGLISQRISQIQGDSTSMMRQIRVAINRY